MPEPAPYQIELDDGRFIFAPADVDECVHALSTPTPASPEAEDGFYYLSKLMDEDRDDALDIDASGVVEEIDEAAEDAAADEGLDAAVSSSAPARPALARRSRSRIPLGSIRPAC